MSHYCQDHPRYEGKSTPKPVCGRCWSLFFLKNPEDKDRLREQYVEAEKLREAFTVD